MVELSMTLLKKYARLKIIFQILKSHSQKKGSSCSIENQPCKNLQKISSSKNSKLHKKNLKESPESFVSSDQSNVVNCVHSQFRTI